MRAQGGGLIINVWSGTSRMRIPGLAGYAATKAALNLLSETARAELAADNIRVIVVYPRVTATSFGQNSLGNRALRQRQREGNAGLDSRPAAHMTPDSADFVAGKILDAAVNEPVEQNMA
jgi:short-subunit dehydrogenase